MNIQSLPVVGGGVGGVDIGEGVTEGEEGDGEEGIGSDTLVYGYTAYVGGTIPTPVSSPVHTRILVPLRSPSLPSAPLSNASAVSRFAGSR